MGAFSPCLTVRTDMKITVYGNPQKLKRHRSKRVKGKIIQYDPSSKDKAELRKAMMPYRPDTPIVKPIHLEIHAFFARPKAHFTANDRTRPLKNKAPIFHTGTPDADNIIKFYCDALNGIFWIDDKIIASVSCTKWYSDTPRCEFILMGLEL